MSEKNGKAKQCDNCYRFNATVKIWCPTWWFAENGPNHYCDECRKTFDPDHNPHAKGGSWHLDEGADEAFRAVKFIHSSDILAYHRLSFGASKGRLLASYLPVGCDSRWELWYHDQQVLLVMKRVVIILGPMGQARRLFPAFFDHGIRKEDYHVPTPRTIRFWERYKGSTVKVTMKPESTFSLYEFSRTDEGFWRQAREYESDGLSLTCKMYEDSRDCDGRYSFDSTYEWEDVNQMRPCYYDGDDGEEAVDFERLFPCWTRVTSNQRDYSAEATGY